MTQNETENLGRRIAALHEGRSRSQFSKELGVPDSTLGNYERNDRIPDADFLARLRRATGVDLNELLAPGASSMVPMSIDTGHASVSPPRVALIPAGGAGSEEDDIVRLPRYDVKASAGRGLIAVDEMQMGEVAFGRTYLRKLGGNPDFCYALEASGDSMWPTISDGDLLIADSSQNEPEDGRIFHFNAGNRVLVKRARWQMDGKLRLTSDNAAAGYPDEVFGADEAGDVRAGGRVIFIGGPPMPVRAS